MLRIAGQPTGRLLVPLGRGVEATRANVTLSRFCFPREHSHENSHDSGHNDSLHNLLLVFGILLAPMLLALSLHLWLRSKSLAVPLQPIQEHIPSSITQAKSSNHRIHNTSHCTYCGNIEEQRKCTNNGCKRKSEIGYRKSNIRFVITQHDNDKDEEEVEMEYSYPGLHESMRKGSSSTRSSTHNLTCHGNPDEQVHTFNPNNNF